MMDLRTFFLTTIPGLETVTHLELCEKWAQAPDFFQLSPYPSVDFYRGGLEFQAPSAWGLELNRYLRTNTRMLLRLSKFEAKNEKEFIKGLKAIPWEQYFAKKGSFDFSLSSKSSKISMTRQVQKVLEQTLKPLSVRYEKGGPKIYVRLFRDMCNISLDCSGEAAFKRGNSKGSIASLRESTANGLLRLLFQGLTEPFELIDPMCGSGTFLYEALSMGQALQRPFSYQKFPLLKESEPVELATEGLIPEKVWGFDISDKALSLAKKNAKNFDSSLFHLGKEDLFSPLAEGSLRQGRDKVVVLNPPWGRRLPGASQDVLKAVYKKYQPKRIGILIPSHWKLTPIPLEKVRDIPILNSGVENRFLLFS